MISVAEDLDLRFRFFCGTAFAKDDSSSSFADVDPVLAVVNEETVAGGIIFGSLQKNSASSSSKSQSFLSFPVLALCSLTFLYFSSNFFHLFAHCSPVTFTDELALNCSATLFHATFFHTFPLSKRPAFSRRMEINSFVLFVVHVTSFSSFFSPGMK